MVGVRTRSGRLSPAVSGSVSPYVGSPDRQLRKSNDLKYLKYLSSNTLGLPKEEWVSSDRELTLPTSGVRSGAIEATR